jgi:rhamnogalacturonan endolyase
MTPSNTIVLILLFLGFLSGHAQPVGEKLDRGFIALPAGQDSTFLSWRLLADDPETLAFTIYRDGKRLNETPTKVTNFMDVSGGEPAQYALQLVIDGVAKEPMEMEIRPWDKEYLEIPLQTPEGYSPNDASVGDLDGDGQYEIVVHMTGRGKDNSQSGITSEPIFHAYEMDGTFLWSINLGKNIREGAHYTQFIVFDLDGDGKAEVAMKTADGTIDGQGKTIGDAEADWVERDEASRGYGKILRGPEYFTIFAGTSGAELATTAYIPERGNIGEWGGVGGNGGNDASGNRVDRFLAGVAYLDGKAPSVIMSRGYYGRSVIAAWDWRNGKLSSRWVFDSAEPGLELFSGQGNHGMSIADVDEDGKQEIIFGAMVIDDDGTGLFSTGLRHGDALHVSDLDPNRPGLEVWGIHENEEPVTGYENGLGEALYDAKTGEIIFGNYPGMDLGRGCAADIGPTYPGYELWSNHGGLKSCTGEEIGERPRATNFVLWWDGDLLRELLDRNKIMKWDWVNKKEAILLQDPECESNNGSKATPVLSADLFGDWREEVIWRTRDNKRLRIYSTPHPSKYRFCTLMQDAQYRTAIAWQNVGYNQPPHPGFFLGEGMKATPMNPTE